jgi:hypothetical protein
VLEWRRDPPARAGLVTSKRVGRWTFYKRDGAALAAFKQKIAEEL